MGVWTAEARAKRGAAYGECAGLLFVGSLLVVILMPLSFSKVEYYEGCLNTQRSTGKVDRDKIWKTGNHLTGPDYMFRCFPISAQNFNQQLSVWSRSSATDAGSALTLDISFQYQLMPEKLGELYSLVTLDYDSIITSNAIDAIKNTGPLFGIDQYLTQRAVVEATFSKNVSIAIADVFAEVVALELRDVRVESEYAAARLAAAIQEESNAKEDYIQQATLVREQTEVEVVKIENDARRVEVTAQSKGLYITSSAEYEAKRLVENARNLGYKELFDTLGISAEAHKASLDYIITLSEVDAAQKKTYVNFDPVGQVDVSSS